MLTVIPEEFVAVMAPQMLRVAALASATKCSRVSHKALEHVAGSEGEVGRQSRVEVFSALDISIQEMLLSAVYEHWPFVRVLAEEDTLMNANFGASSEFWVLIDPLDGTKNYLEQDPRYCHIVSLVHRDKMLASLLYSHAVGRLFVATRGGGTNLFSLAGRAGPVGIPTCPAKVFLHHVSRIPEALLNEIRSQELKIGASTQNATDILSLIEGKASGFISYAPVVYDVWSPGMIIQEAGGWLSDWAGRPLIFNGQTRLPHVLIASSSAVAYPIIERLSRYL
jgi:fructose-1,6-bisphosphatase/inositol monophosphatase family enzyme